MRYLKGLTLAAMATTVALLAVGMGGASAAELYSTGVTVNAGTVVHTTLEIGTTLKTSTTDEKTLIGTCSSNTLEGDTNAYSAGAVTLSVTKLTWGGCTVTTDTLTSGSLSISGTGLVTGSASVWTTNFAGVSCRYGTGASTSLGTLTTGTLAVNAVINEQEPKQFLCPDTTKWVANYTVTSPHDLTVK